MKYLLYIIEERFNMIFNIKKIYKCVAYIKEKDNVDKLVEAFEVKEASDRRAFKVAYDMLKLKYPNMGFDIRISKN